MALTCFCGGAAALAGAREGGLIPAGGGEMTEPPGDITRGGGAGCKREPAEKHMGEMLRV